MPVHLRVKVKPHAKVSSLARAADGTWIAQVKSSPVAGKANEELLGLVAKHFGCLRAAVTIKAGKSSRTKLVRVES